ncbi:membrane protein [Steroidobacter agaridevorans]|uniref:Membrane protein n=1 Tax=Steroidobacter agaridevorans TaxID=2695856 RepID=A0A829Y9V9_9GAMM|nr:thiol-disulfide oxidoreductase DCC family protein [Steroidobacter agaridevorans]GFE79412.1 membrane protein [Steroidobacter agaridevorans]GFE88417.1 membrane protein [Steroidobacter agaridevorans]
MDRVLVFDGVCVLCGHWVGFVLEHDRHRLYKFAAMQTATGRELLRSHGLDPNDPQSFLLLEGGRGYMDTDALIRVLKSFGGRWRAVATLIQLTPRFLRDALYRATARNRYKLFGRHDVCIVPSAQTADRFLS